MTEREYILVTNLARLREISRMLGEMTFPTPAKKFDKAHYMPGARDNASEAVGRLIAYHERSLRVLWAL